jgi:hypothetical protein
LDKFMGPEGVRAVVDDHDAAELDAVDAAIVDLADKVALDATTVTQADVDSLRAFGLTGQRHLASGSMPSPSSTLLNKQRAAAVRTTSRNAQLDPALRDLLAAGRSIAQP